MFLINIFCIFVTVGRLAQCGLLTIKLNKMTELQRKFIEETGVSFDGIPINGVHLEYITWLEAQIQALRQPLVSGRSEQFCPECKSLNVELDYGLGELYCHKCEKLVGRNFH